MLLLNKYGKWNYIFWTEDSICQERPLKLDCNKMGGNPLISLLLNLALDYFPFHLVDVDLTHILVFLHLFHTRKLAL